MSAMQIIAPDKFKANILEYQTKPEYVEWLMSNRENYGPSAATHKSSPFVWTGESEQDTEFIGGCDAALAFFRSQQGKPRAPQLPAISSSTEAKDEYDYDLVVIGGGSGGLACSKEAAELGARVAVLDFVKPSPAGSTWGLGGTCVNVGCIPKKLMHRAALLGEAITDAQSYGWPTFKPEHSWDTLVESVQTHIQSLNFGYRVSLRDKNVTYLNALGRFEDAHTITATDAEGGVTRITSARFVVAVGGRPTPLTCEGGELAISSDDLFSLKTPPGKTLVVGASYVALECAGFLTAVGFDTTVMVRSILLRGFDRECVDRIGTHMEEEGTKFIRGKVPQSLVRLPSGKIQVTWDGGSDEFDTVFCAIGRSADTPLLNIEAAGVTPSPRNGKLECTNETTEVAHIHAIGDVMQGCPELTPVAIRAGRLLAQRLFGGGREPMDYQKICTTVFTPLEYGCCGMTEEEALEVVGAENLEVYHSSFTPLEWSVVHSKPSDRCFAKLICDKRYDNLVVGMHFLGPNAGEVTQGFGVAMRMGATFADFEATVGIHPTTAEELTDLKVTKASGESATKGGC